MAQYWIKGEDGEEYGPSTLEELSEWLKENRVGVDTPVRVDGGLETWQPWQTYPELMALMAQHKAQLLFLGQSHLVLATFVQRAAAYIIDMLILIFSLSIVITVVFGPVYMSRDQAWKLWMGQTQMPDELAKFYQIFEMFFLLLYIIYFTYFHGSTGQTFGKKLLGIRVVDAHGLTISYRSAFIRAIASFLSQIPFSFYIGFLMALVTTHRRAFHDLMAHTYVARVIKPK